MDPLVIRISTTEALMSRVRPQNRTLPPIQVICSAKQKVLATPPTRRHRVPPTVRTGVVHRVSPPLCHGIIVQTSTPQIEDTQTSKVAITGAIIGGVLVVLALVGVGVYRTRLSSTQETDEFRATAYPLGCGALPIPFAASVVCYEGLERRPLLSRHGISIREPERKCRSMGASSPPVSPDIRASFHSGGASPLRSPAARSFCADPYGMASSGRGASPIRSPEARSVTFRTDSTTSLSLYSVPSSPNFMERQGLEFHHDHSDHPLRNGHTRLVVMLFLCENAYIYEYSMWPENSPPV
ncbi:hypothetical protein B0H10DRAFT_463301 [Mycena sp. CBHHK59/15]|nr:hypothetical protein B0H10DRAFT_463301 [Mycena sp. CBHHK59/15]